MPEQQSALAASYEVGQIGAVQGAPAVEIHERLAPSLVQISGWPDSFSGTCDKLRAALNIEIPGDLTRAVTNNDRSVFRVGPERLLFTGPSDDQALQSFDESILGEEGCVTDISHSRTLIRISGPATRTLLNRGLPVDLDNDLFPVGAFAQSSIHHIPVLVHRADHSTESGDQCCVFDVYVSREYAVTFWEWLIEAAQALGAQVTEAR